MPSPTVSRRSGFVPGGVSCCPPGVAINWLNGQRFSTFHFIRDNGLCTEGRMRELLSEREKEGEAAKDNISTGEYVAREHYAEIDFPRSILPRTIDSTRNRFSFPLS